MFDSILKAAIALAIQEGLLVEEDGVLLSPTTINLVNEIQEMNRQHLIDMALANNDRELFMQLTN
ncbi:IDEAL domain-containing protein [Lysinibacillus irui]|uniref:IDEAL domain-containing protein n=1 Tax=Lysinibacillus irui TaxID=2998077 RepID=A0ABU5NRG4_9BACI|nr:IDEAL domain-containing protein [Lysinibacillus irui]MEA0554628.1 IDEAL domain-containing protein [Lysinibacillus irui]MEA0978652.1 IDEAL domain-containing protein [Lysinibacillus irui]MEA1044806.1 IDEAL domain-containing protein [Lysinibacillus irui]